MIKLLRRIAGRVLRVTGLRSFFERTIAPAADRLYHTLRYRNSPARLAFAGHEIRVQIDSAATLRFTGLFTKHEVSLLGFILDSTKPGDIVWDIGANRGMFSLFFSRHVGEHGRVFSFEPEARAFSQLSANIALNGAKNVTPLAYALGAETRDSVLHTQGIGRHSLRELDASDMPVGAQPVRVVRGDSIAGTEVPVPRAIKIDVEGWEFDVLAGLSGVLDDPRLEAIGIELHPRLMRAERPNAQQDLADFLARHRFVIAQTVPISNEVHCLCTRPAEQSPIP
jgi:FkbM family methyltransferase